MNIARFSLRRARGGNSNDATPSGGSGDGFGEDDEARMREEQAARVEGDPWEDVIAAWTTRRAGETFTMNELLEAGLGLSASSQNPRVTSRVRRILEGLGFERRRTSAGGRRSYFYARAHERARAPLPHCPTSNEKAFANHDFNQEDPS